MVSKIRQYLSSVIGARPLRVTMVVAMVMVLVALMTLSREFYMTEEHRDHSFTLSLFHNLMVYGSYALLGPLMYRLADWVAGMPRSWFVKFLLHLVFGVSLVLTHMLLCHMVWYTLGLSEWSMFSGFLAEYPSNVIHILMMVYWALAGYVTFQKNLAQQKPPKENRELLALQRFMVRKDGKSAFLDFDQVLWIETYEDYQKLHTAHETHLIRDAVDDLEQKLPDDIFRRAHQSYFVNLRHLAALVRPDDKNGYYLKLDNGKQLELSQAYHQHFAVS